MLLYWITVYGMLDLTLPRVRIRPKVSPAKRQTRTHAAKQTCCAFLQYRHRRRVHERKKKKMIIYLKGSVCSPSSG